MPSHKVTLTNKGFKILSTDLAIDIVSLILAFTILLVGGSWNSGKILFIFSIYIISTILYFLYRYKIGYIYVIGFFYQITLYIILTPGAFLTWPIMILSFLSTAPFFWKKNTFSKIYFPYGLFLSLISSFYGLLFNTFSLKKLPSLAYESGTSFLNYSKIPGSYFVQGFSEGFYFSQEYFSSLELSGLFSIICLGSILLRQFHFILDLILLNGMYFILSYYFRFDFSYFQERILILVVGWYLILMAPGRNFGFSYIFSIISLVFTGLFCYLLTNGENIFPPIIIVILFFVIQSVMYYLVTKNLFNRVPLIKNFVRK
ncbi:MAG: hypothetical protein KDK36_15465 [Leptospiraceae bacterium]|nr:hypothetical protein [Leptospiraceae bacterium]